MIAETILFTGSVVFLVLAVGLLREARVLLDEAKRLCDETPLNYSPKALHDYLDLIEGRIDLDEYRRRGRLGEEADS